MAHQQGTLSKTATFWKGQPRVKDENVVINPQIDLSLIYSKRETKERLFNFLSLRRHIQYQTTREPCTKRPMAVLCMQAVHDSMHVAHTHIRARVQRKIYCVLLNNALPLSQHYAILGEGKACISCTLIRSKKTDRQFILFFVTLYLSSHATFPRDPPSLGIELWLFTRLYLCC